MQHYPPLDPWGAAPPGAPPAYPPQQQYPPPQPQQQAYPGAPTGGAYPPQPQQQQAPAYPGAAAYPAQPSTPYGAPPQGQPAGYPGNYPPQPHVPGGAHYPQAAPQAPAAAGYPHQAPAGYPGGYPTQQQAGYPSAGGYPQQQQQQQHQQPQRPPAGAAASGGQVAVVDSRYCFPQPLDLMMKEAMTMGSYGADNFQIMDASGRTYFMLKASHFSMSDKRFLLDASGQPVVGMAKKMLSMKPTWLMHRGGSFDSGTQVAVVKAHFSLTPSVSVYLNDGDKESDFKIRGDFRSKKFTVSQKLGGGRERQVAEVKKESRFSSTTAFLTAALTSADNYVIHIEPGVDAAFIVGVAVLVDELFHDQQQ